MTALRWDQVGDRGYEAGIDRGVLYVSSGRGYAWNGLVSVDENPSGSTPQASYFDGTTIAETVAIQSFVGVIKAYTYPDEFLEYDGTGDLENGLLVNEQRRKRFGLSYRTHVGNDDVGIDHGYKIHLVYNLLAVPQTITRKTLSNVEESVMFGWDVSAIPDEIEGMHPSAHLIIDSTKASVELMAKLEDILYGTYFSKPRLPEVQELVTFMEEWTPRVPFLEDQMFVIDADYPTGLPTPL